MNLEHGDQIPIEEREPSEIFNKFGKITAPPEVNFFNPAFDVTPTELITGIITDKGVIYPPFKDGIAALFE